MTLSELGAFAGISAGVLQALAYLDYNRQVFAGKTNPNGSTWLIWTLLAGLSAATYRITTDDWAKTVLSFVNAALCILTFALALLRKKFDRPDVWDLIALGTGLAAVFAWYEYQSAQYANYVLQVSIAIGFVPTYRMLWTDPHKERLRPWLIWTSAYSTLLLAVILRWRGQWQDLIYPINCIVLHTALVLLVLARTQKLKNVLSHSS